MDSRAPALQVGHIDASGVPVGWSFCPNHCTKEQLRAAEEAPTAMDAVQSLGWSKDDIREFWLYIRRN